MRITLFYVAFYHSKRYLKYSIKNKKDEQNNYCPSSSDYIDLIESFAELIESNDDISIKAILS